MPTIQTDEDWSVISSSSDIDNDDDRSTTSSREDLEERDVFGVGTFTGSASTSSGSATPSSFQLPRLFYAGAGSTFGEGSVKVEDDFDDTTPAHGSIIERRDTIVGPGEVVSASSIDANETLTPASIATPTSLEITSPILTDSSSTPDSTRTPSSSVSTNIPSPRAIQTPPHWYPEFTDTSGATTPSTAASDTEYNGLGTFGTFGAFGALIAPEPKRRKSDLSPPEKLQRNLENSFSTQGFIIAALVVSAIAAFFHFNFVIVSRVIEDEPSLITRFANSFNGLLYEDQARVAQTWFFKGPDKPKIPRGSRFFHESVEQVKLFATHGADLRPVVLRVNRVVQEAGETLTEYALTANKALTRFALTTDRALKGFALTTNKALTGYVLTANHAIGKTAAETANSIHEAIIILLRSLEPFVNYFGTIISKYNSTHLSFLREGCSMEWLNVEGLTVHNTKIADAASAVNVALNDAAAKGAEIAKTAGKVAVVITYMSAVGAKKAVELGSSKLFD